MKIYLYRIRNFILCRGDLLRNRVHGIKYKDGHVMWIKYPKSCPYTKGHVGDYCWGLALAYENNKVEEFIQLCPCSDEY